MAREERYISTPIVALGDWKLKFRLELEIRSVTLILGRVDGS